MEERLTQVFVAALMIRRQDLYGMSTNHVGIYCGLGPNFRNEIYCHSLICAVKRPLDHKMCPELCDGQGGSVCLCFPTCDVLGSYNCTLHLACPTIPLKYFSTAVILSPGRVKRLLVDSKCSYIVSLQIMRPLPEQNKAMKRRTQVNG